MRNLLMLLLVCVLLAVAGTCHKAQAADVQSCFLANSTSEVHVLQDGVEKFCSAGLSTINGDRWNFTGQCVNVPPAPDTLAYLNVLITWEQSPEIRRMTDVTSFWNLFGHVSPDFPIQGWPGANGATVKAPDTSNLHYRWWLGPLPINPGILSHVLKAVSYGKSPPTLRANFAVVKRGDPMPTGTATPCYFPNKAFDDQNALNLNPIVINSAGQIVSGRENTSKCSIYIRQDNPALITYDVMADTVGNGVMSLSFN